MNQYEVWTDAEGCQLMLVPTAFPAVVADDGDDDGFEWYPDGPGQRPPQRYELQLLSGDPIAAHVVFPVEPWTAYDAISDRLIREGFTPPVSEPVGECEHGLSIDLCFGPNHYYDERYA